MVMIMVQHFEASCNSSSFNGYVGIVALGIGLIPLVTPPVAILIITGIAKFRLKIIDKQNLAEDKGKIDIEDKPLYTTNSSKNATVSNTTVSPSNSSEFPTSTSVTPSDTGGNNLVKDPSSILKGYIDDLYKALTKGDNLLQDENLG